MIVLLIFLIGAQVKAEMAKTISSCHVCLILFPERSHGAANFVEQK